MGEELNIIYKILKLLQKTMDLEEIDEKLISPDTLGISKPKWNRIMLMLAKEGYVDGICVTQIDNLPMPLIDLYNPSITLKGLEYLEENSLMKKAAKLAKGIAEVIP